MFSDSAVAASGSAAEGAASEGPCPRLVASRTVGEVLAAFGPFFAAHEEQLHFPWSFALRGASSATGPATPCLALALCHHRAPLPRGGFPPACSAETRSPFAEADHGGTVVDPLTVSAFLFQGDVGRPPFLFVPATPSGGTAATGDVGACDPGMSAFVDKDVLRALLGAWDKEPFSTPCVGVMAVPSLASAFLEYVQRTRPDTCGPAACTVQREQEVFLVQRVPVAPDRRVEGGMIKADQTTHQALLVAWCTAFHAESHHAVPSKAALAPAQGLSIATSLLSRDIAHLWVLPDGTPVCLAASVHGRSGTLARLSFVYTPPEVRGRGFASALVDAVARHVREEHRLVPCLFADRHNPVSNRVYAKLGFAPSSVGVIDMLTLESMVL